MSAGFWNVRIADSRIPTSAIPGDIGGRQTRPASREDNCCFLGRSFSPEFDFRSPTQYSTKYCNPIMYQLLMTIIDQKLTCFFYLRQIPMIRNYSSRLRPMFLHPGPRTTPPRSSYPRKNGNHLPLPFALRQITYFPRKPPIAG